MTARPLALGIAIAFVAAKASAQRQPTISDLRPEKIARAGTDSCGSKLRELILVNSDSVDRLRLNQLANGVDAGRSLMLRSSSSIGAGRCAGGAWIGPQFLYVRNTSLPFSQNNGALWAGKGVNTRFLAGGIVESNHIRLIVAPELVSSGNRNWRLDPRFYEPPVPAGYDQAGNVLPYYFHTFPIDQPIRFGTRPIQRLDPGQSAVVVKARSIEFGLANENEWWGPGIRNAIVLSNNAPGFPHLFVRARAPIATRLGDVDWRWLVGGLTESHYFDTVSTNNVRSIAAFAATLQTKWNPNLTFGLARSVYGTANGWGQVPWRWLDILARTNSGKQSPLVPHRDSLLTPGGKDQILSLFTRWVLPEDGVEIYAEWARRLLSPSLRELLIAPNHTQGYTIGAQWRSKTGGLGDVRIQTEVTQLEQSATFRDEPVGSWYTSRRVIQGYTNRGEVLGASIGPGASSQWFALDYLRSTWSLGAFAGRIRWNEDVHSTFGFPVYVGYCNHDVSLFTGFRGSKAGRFGFVSANLNLQNRLTPFFQNGGGCPNVGDRIDVRNNTLTMTFSPFHR